jgi:hypothetical protein
MAFVDATPLLEHVVRLGRGGIRGAVSVDIRPDVRQEVGSIAGFGDRGAEPLQLAAVVLEDFAVAGEIVLF